MIDSEATFWEEKRNPVQFIFLDEKDCFLQNQHHAEINDEQSGNLRGLKRLLTKLLS